MAKFEYSEVNFCNNLYEKIFETIVPSIVVISTMWMDIEFFYTRFEGSPSVFFNCNKNGSFMKGWIFDNLLLTVKTYAISGFIPLVGVRDHETQNLKIYIPCALEMEWSL